MEKPHVVMVPCPAQGHVLPLMELAQHLAEHGIRVTFVNTESIHQSIIETFSSTEKSNTLDERIRLVSVIHDGLDLKDRSERERFLDTIYRMLPRRIEEMVEEINGSGEEEKVTCIISDSFLGKCQEFASKLGIRSAVFHPVAAAEIALQYNIQNLMEDGIIDSDGSPIKNQVIQLGPKMPTVTTSDLIWTKLGSSLAVQKLIVNIMMENNIVLKSAEWLICNSVNELEPGAFALVPELVPIGPLLASNRLGNSVGHLWEQDYSCLTWLDQQKANSVIYVAFGSSTNFNSEQFQELALGLELTNRPFLWVIRSGIVTGDKANCTFPEGFTSRVANRGLISSWAPQQKVLSHPSITCFVSHCGWNSTIESASNGVPLICLPYNGDQFMNRSYICDVWKVGLELEKSASGIVTSEEMKNKVDQLLGDDTLKERALRLKETILISTQEGENSHKTLTKLISWIKG